MHYTKKNDNSAQYRTWLEIDREAVAHNYNVFRSYIPKNTLLASVVKSNAYGHGLVEFAEEIVSCGADWIVVDSVVEAFVLRKKGLQVPILVLGYTLPRHVAKAVEENIRLTISSFEALEDIQKVSLEKPLLVHIKVDTGMFRQGFLSADKEKLLGALRGIEKKVCVEGMYTHFAAAKDPNGPDETKEQIRIFKEWTSFFEGKGHKLIKHAGATSGTLLYPDAHFDMVRVGIGMYGLWPSKDVFAYGKDMFELKPVLSWKTILGEIKNVPKGAGVGYDFSEKVKRDSKIAICPVGYWHGYRRGLSSKAEVLVHGVRAKILGRISMDMIIIDVTDVPNTKVGDVVTLLGQDGNERISAEELAEILDTCNYEVITGINPRIKRVAC